MGNNFSKVIVVIITGIMNEQFTILEHLVILYLC